jgi:FkbM family methyltransferase
MLDKTKLTTWIAEGEANLASLPSLDEPAWIYGYGVFGRDLYRILVSAGARVSGFVDAHKSGQVAAETGTLILSLGELPENSLLIQSINNPAFPIHTINAQLRPLCRRLLNPLEALWWAGCDLLWASRPSNYIPHLDRIVAISKRIVSEDQSLYAGVWHDRLTGHFEVLNTATPNPYFPTNIPDIPRQLNLVDCGAYDGDVARDALISGRTLRRWFAFEPDPDNFSRLQIWLGKHRCAVGEVMALPIAVGAENTILSFSGGLSTSSHLSTDGTLKVPCVRLSDILAQVPVNYIKFDVEGAEADALKGAADLIKRQRPVLAVSVYHRPEDLYALPELIDEIAPGYRMHLRLHALAGIDSVLYAIPETLAD